MEHEINKDKRMPCPLNEFSDHCTADMPSMDISLHKMMNPDSSDFPESAKRELKYWKDSKNIK
jgi:hypothetical protein